MLIGKLKSATAALVLVVVTSHGLVVVLHQAAAGIADSPSPGIGEGPKSPRQQIEEQSPVSYLAWSHDSMMVATVTTDGPVRIRDSATGKEIVSFATGPGVDCLAFSPNGKTLVLHQQEKGNLSTWDIGTGKFLEDGQLFVKMPLEHLAFTTDGSAVAGIGIVTAAGGAVYCKYVQWGAGLFALATAANGPGFAAIAPDASVCGWYGGTGPLRLHRFEKGADAKFESLEVGKAVAMAFSRGCKFLAVSGEDKVVNIWDLKTMKKTAQLAGLAGSAVKLSFSADGKTLAALVGDGLTVQVWDLTRNSRGAVRQPTTGGATMLALSPDGKVLATIGKDRKSLFLRKVILRELARGGPSLELSAMQMAQYWADLASADVEKADNAWQKLGAVGDNVVPFLREQIRPIAVPDIDANKIAKQVNDLDAEKFATRQQAVNELIATGELVIVFLQRFLEMAPSLEGKMRAEMVLKKVAEAPPAADRLRAFEAIDLLEQMGMRQGCRTSARDRARCIGPFNQDVGPRGLAKTAA